MANSPIPPTYAEVVLFDPDGKHPRFNPVWLKWFVDLAETQLTAAEYAAVQALILVDSALLALAAVETELLALAAEETALSALAAVDTELLALAAVETELSALAAVTPITATITTAALSGAGTQGSMTFTNGLLTAQTQAT